VAIYYAEDVLAPPIFGLHPALHKRLKGILRREGIRTEAWVDTRPAGEQIEVWKELQRAATERRVQGVIVTTAGFTVRFGAPAPADATLDWILVR